MSFMENIQKALSQGFDASKEFLEKAGHKAKEMGEKGVLKLEIMQLNSQVEKLCAKLGAQVYLQLDESKDKPVNFELPEVAHIIEAINEAKDIIEGKEELLAKTKDEPSSEEKSEEPSDKS